MSNAQQNAAKLRAWADPASYPGADPTGATYSDAAFAAALATGRPIRVSPGAWKLGSSIARTLAAGQDFVLEGYGPEVSRLIFDGGGISVTYSGTGNSVGDTSSVSVRNLGIETAGAGVGDGLTIIDSTESTQPGTRGTVFIEDLNFSGSTASTYWLNAIKLGNVSFPAIKNIRVDDGAKRTIALNIYTAVAGAVEPNSVDFNIWNLKAFEVLCGVYVRGRVEGVQLTQCEVVGCTTGIDWVATLLPGGGKKPLLLMDACHINTTGTAVTLTDVSQAICSDSLIYIFNNDSVSNYAFKFEATSALSSENGRLDGITIIGQADRTASLTTGVYCGANVFGMTIDATMDNIGTCVSSVDINRTVIAPGSRLTNYNTRSVGFYNVGSTSGGSGGGVSVDATLQMEAIGADTYERDMYREQLRAGSFTYEATAADEDVTHDLTRPFRTDCSVLVCSFGETPTSGATVHAKLPGSTASQLLFRLEGVTPATTYRINYIAYGY